MITIGLDVGSTTVKAVVLDKDKNVLWKSYERHQTKQLEKVTQFCERIKDDLSIKKFRLFATGSGGRRVADILNAKFIQEVNALSFAVEDLHEDVGSVFELGGQDAKFIVWIKDKKGARKFATMNDKCAGGTGATIDRIFMKLHINETQIRHLTYDSKKIHPVAGKCGVFAETDINSLQKQGVNKEELMVSLFDAIVQQNLSILTRGHTPRPKVLLLGGPNAYFKVLQEAWSHNIKTLWDERGIAYEKNEKTVVTVPEDALYYVAYGSALLGSFEKHDAFVVEDLMPLRRAIEEKEKQKATSGTVSLSQSAEELATFLKAYEPKPFVAPVFQKECIVRAFIGIDGGSTSTKGVLVNKSGEVIATAYKLSEGSPIEDAKDILFKLKNQIEQDGAVLKIEGVGFTGYAKDLLKEAFDGDVAIVETVAHTLGALKYVPDAEVICDVGGQDIKIITLRGGRVKDFKLNTQCSAGNGYYLQSTANRFGCPIEEYANIAFRAKYCPSFNFGCAVFLESDIVNFQQLGWEAEEIMAGLAKVLPLNIWLYVVQEPNLSRLGKVYVLQGGTHNNLAVVKTQVDYIKSKIPDAKIFVHPFNGVAGAIGAALEAKRKVM